MVKCIDEGVVCIGQWLVRRRSFCHQIVALKIICTSYLGNWLNQISMLFGRYKVLFVISHTVLSFSKIWRRSEVSRWAGSKYLTTTRMNWMEIQYWPKGNIAQLRSIIFQCWSRLTVNICSFPSQSNKTKWIIAFFIIKSHPWRSNIEYALIHLILPSDQKNRCKCMVWCSLHHVLREHGSRDAMFPGNMTLHWRNWTTLFIFAHHVTHIGPITITNNDDWRMCRSQWNW